MTAHFSEEARIVFQRICELDTPAGSSIMTLIDQASLTSIDDRMVWILYQRCATGHCLDLEIQARVKTFRFSPQVVECLEWIAEMDRNLVMEIVNRALATNAPFLDIHLLGRILSEMRQACDVFR